MGTHGIEIVDGKEKIFFTRPTRTAKAEQKSLVPERQAKRTNQGGPHSPQFQQSAVATPLNVTHNLNICTNIHCIWFIFDYSMWQYEENVHIKMEGALICLTAVIHF
jgi:hypothetical protein